MKVPVAAIDQARAHGFWKGLNPLFDLLLMHTRGAELIMQSPSWKVEQDVTDLLVNFYRHAVAKKAEGDDSGWREPPGEENPLEEAGFSKRWMPNLAEIIRLAVGLAPAVRTTLHLVKDRDRPAHATLWLPMPCRSAKHVLTHRSIFPVPDGTATSGLPAAQILEQLYPALNEATGRELDPLFRHEFAIELRRPAEIRTEPNLGKLVWSTIQLSRSGRTISQKALSAHSGVVTKTIQTQYREAPDVGSRPRGLARLEQDTGHGWTRVGGGYVLRPSTSAPAAIVLMCHQEPSAFQVALETAAEGRGYPFDVIPLENCHCDVIVYFPAAGKTVGVERKNLVDLDSSLRHGRLDLEYLAKLAGNHDRPYLLVEGEQIWRHGQDGKRYLHDDHKKLTVEEEWWKGFTAKHEALGVTQLASVNPRDSAEKLMWLVERTLRRGADGGGWDFVQENGHYRAEDVSENMQELPPPISA
jgi:hypothetical protein